MPVARLSITAPTDSWVHEVSTAHPDATFRVITALAGEQTGIALVDVQTADALSVITDVSQQSDVVDFELLWKRDDAALLQVETTTPPLLVPLWKAGVPVEMPFTLSDGDAIWEVTTSSSRFSDFGQFLDEAGIQYDIEYVHEIGRGEVDRLLTNRQQEVLVAAFDAGYYATPRESTLTDVATELDISKATCSDVLHRAEGSLVSWFVDEHLSV